MLNSIQGYCQRNNNTNCGGVQGRTVGDDFCYTRNKNRWPDLNKFLLSFPNFTFVLDNNQNYTLTGVEYLFSEVIGSNTYCLGFYEYGSRIILGGIFMRNHDFHFDKEAQMITITEANCSSRVPFLSNSPQVAINWDLPQNSSASDATPVSNETQSNETQSESALATADKIWSTPVEIPCNHYNINNTYINHV